MHIGWWGVWNRLQTTASALHHSSMETALMRRIATEFHYDQKKVEQKD